MSKNNVLKNQEIIIIQNEIDNLENLLFSLDKESSQNESNSNIINNITKTYQIEKINNNSFKNGDALSKNENNITYQIQDKILFSNSNNLENNLYDSKTEKNNEKNMNNANIKCHNINSDNLKKIMELINLQKEVDILREKREKKINYKTKKLNKIYNNNNKTNKIKK